MTIVGLSFMLVITFYEAKPLALAALFVLILLVKDNYKIYLDIIAKDGLYFSGTVVKADTPTKLFSIEIDFYYSLEIETDNGDYVKCASKAVGLMPGDRIENAYVTRRSNLLLSCDMPRTNNFSGEEGITPIK